MLKRMHFYLVCVVFLTDLPYFATEITLFAHAQYLLRLCDPWENSTYLTGIEIESVHHVYILYNCISCSPTMFLAISIFRPTTDLLNVRSTVQKGDPLIWIQYKIFRSQAC